MKRITKCSSTKVYLYLVKDNKVLQVFINENFHTIPSFRCMTKFYWKAFLS